MKLSSVLFAVLVAIAMSTTFWLHATPKPQDRKVRVWVFSGNDGADSIVQSIEAKFNSTMRYETVKDMQTDIIVLVGCFTDQDNAKALKNDWICASTVQVVVGDLVALPHDAGNDLVVGSSEFVAQRIFDKTVSKSGENELQARRAYFRKRIYVYCQRFNCSDEVK
jgi:hypothetical protein